MSDLPTIPPHSGEAEQSVLGAILLDNAALSTARQILTPSAFYLGKHHTIFAAMLALADRGVAIDNVTLTDTFSQEALKEIGGSAYLVELFSAVASAANIEHHARIVSEKAQIRTLRHSLRTALDALEGGASVGQVTTRMTQLQCAATELLSAPIHSTPDLVPSGGFASMPASQFLDEPETSQPTWIWDEFLAEGGLAALVAKPKVGKTTIVSELGLKVSQGLPFLGRGLVRVRS